MSAQNPTPLDAERIETALSVLTDIAQNGVGEDEDAYTRRSAAEEILRHYREERVFSSVLRDGLTININGAVPVRPMTRTEMES